MQQVFVALSNMQRYGKEYKFRKFLFKLYFLLLFVFLLHRSSLRYGPTGAKNFRKKSDDKNGKVFY